MRVKHRPIDTIQLAVTGSYTKLYTALEGTDVRINLTVCNDTTTPVTFTLWKVAKGADPGDGYLIVNQRTLADKESYPVLELIGVVFGPLESLQGCASVASQVTVTGGYVEYTRLAA